MHHLFSLLSCFAGPKYNNRSTYQPVTIDPFALSPDPNEQENLDILGDDDGNASPNNLAAGQGASVRGIDINLPNQDDMDDEIADENVNDEAGGVVSVQLRCFEPK